MLGFDNTMTLPSKDNKLSQQEIESIGIALKQSDIRAIHPNRMEAYAEYLVSKLTEQNDGQETKTCNCTCASGKSICTNRGI